MARINIEEKSYKRIQRLADFVGCSRREALGTVGLLWGESQELLKTDGTREEIIDWSELYALSAEEVEKWFSSMIRARVISAVGDGKWRIHGNELQIEARVSRLNSSLKGGEATKKRWKLLKMAKNTASSGPEDGLRKADSMPAAIHELSNSISGPGLCNAIQFNSMQFNPSAAAVAEAEAEALSGTESFTKGNPEEFGKVFEEFCVGKLGNTGLLRYRRDVMDCFYAVPDEFRAWVNDVITDKSGGAKDIKKLNRYVESSIKGLIRDRLGNRDGPRRNKWGGISA